MRTARRDGRVRPKREPCVDGRATRVGRVIIRPRMDLQHAEVCRGGQHANHLVGLVVQPDRATDNRWVSTEPVAPERLAEEHHAGRARHVLVLAEHPAEQRLDAEHGGEAG